jgi:hypothetical protein
MEIVSKQKADEILAAREAGDWRKADVLLDEAAIDLVEKFEKLAKSERKE